MANHMYEMRYAHSNNDTPGNLAMNATSDTAAVAEVRKFVADGYRNGTWATVELSEGRTYSANNQHGEAVGRYY